MGWILVCFLSFNNPKHDNQNIYFDTYTHIPALINAEDKKMFKKKFIKKETSRKDERYNRKVVVIIYSFLLYKLIKESNGIAKKMKLCNDVMM